MSGHSKWSTIKHKKAASDAKRGKIFSKIAREIMIAVKIGGGDASGNITLRALLQKARSANMPSDNVERAIKKGLGTLDGVMPEEMSFEGFAPGGVAVYVHALSDNRNRSSAEIRHIFTRFGANLGVAGSVARKFQRKGQIVVDGTAVPEDRLMEIVLNVGAEDMRSEDGAFVILTEPATFMDVVDALNKEKIPLQSSEIQFLPLEYMPVTDKAKASQLVKFVEALEDLEDVQNVYANFDIDDQLLKEVEE